MHERSEEAKGFVYGLAAYLGWGFAPLYWPLLQPSSPYEVLAHRVVWSVVFLIALNTAMRAWTPVRTAWMDPRSRRLLIGAAALITINWGLYIWSVNHEHVVDASLGYFITPLLSVAMGVLILGERMRPAQWAAVAIAFASIVILTVDAGEIPWIGLILASTFGSYGLVKKLAQVEAIASLTIETLVAFPFGVAYLIWLGIDALRRRELHAERMVDQGLVAPELMRTLREGFIVGILNPKSLVFFAAVFPQFVDREAGNVSMQLMVLGLVFALIAVLSDGTWGIVAGSAREWLAGNPQRLVNMRIIGGCVMIGLGLVVLIAAPRP